MNGILYVVSTPIGNLGDITLRAVETLKTVDFVAAEDTRVTLRLLNHLGIKKPLVSCHGHNERARMDEVLGRIAAGECAALCSDAGTPAISDPGALLVAGALQRGIPVTPVPGCFAGAAALCASGQDTTRFVFEGFLPQNRGQRQKRLAALAAEERTVIIYEAPHKLPATLRDLAAAFGESRPLTLCRELTKLHEEFIKTTLAGAIAHCEQHPPKGEFVLVMAGKPPEEQPQATLAEAAALAASLIAAEGISKSEAAKRAAAETRLPKSEIYRLLQPPPGKNSPPPNAPGQNAAGKHTRGPGGKRNTGEGDDKRR